MTDREKLRVAELFAIQREAAALADRLAAYQREYEDLLSDDDDDDTTSVWCDLDQAQRSLRDLGDGV